MRLHFLIFLLFTTFHAFSQKDKTKVDLDFFDDKKYEIYKGENAVIEYEIGWVYFSYISGEICVVTETSTRLKILTNDGFDYATVQIPLYRNRYNKETVTVTDAFTYNLEDGKIVKYKLDENSKFLENYSGNHWYASFTMPNVKVGSVIEYKTKVISPYPEDVPEWFFQREIPIKYSKFSFTIPQGLQFRQYIKGAENIKQENVKGSYVFEAENLPAIKNEGYVSNLDNYRASVVHYYNGYRKANGETKFITSTWNDVVELIYKEERFGSRLDEVKFFKPIAYEIVKGKITETDKINAIFEYVQKNFEWDGVTSIVAKNKLEKVYELKKGSSGEINLLLIAMLQSVNLDAHPIILATRSKGISYMPHPNAFNNVIGGVNVNNKVILLDATNKFSTPNIIPLHNANWIGRMINKNGFSKEVNLEPVVASKSIVTGYFNLDLDENNINGTIRSILTNYKAYGLRNQYDNLSETEIKEQFEKKYQLEIDSLNFTNLKENKGDVVEFFKFRKEHAFDRVGNKIYITPAFIYKISKNIFNQESRNYPIDFLYPLQNVYTLTYVIPEGYQVESVPGNKKMVLKSNLFSVSWNFSYDEKKILFKLNIDYNKAVIDADEYLNIKKVFEELVKFMDEKIVLTKK